MSSNPPGSKNKSSDIPDIPTGLPTKPFRTELLDTNPFRDQMPTQLMQRGKYGTLGKIAEIEINSHVVTAWPRMDVFQYDVSPHLIL